MHPLHRDVAALMREVARTVVLPHFRNLAADDIIEKSPGELVTVADRAAEERLAAGLLALDPGAAIVGEEAVAADPAVLDALGAPRVWIIDPIDGTANFAAGRAPFGIMIALAEHGMVQAGWIYDPLRDRLCHAVRGGGAFVDEAPLVARPCDTDRPIAALATQFMTEARRGRVLEQAIGRFEIVPIPRSAAEQYPRLCLGENDIALFQRTLPWDHAAGALLLNEAGGKVARWDGTEYRLDDGKTGLVAGASAALWQVAHDALFDGATGLEAGTGLPLDPGQ